MANLKASIKDVRRITKRTEHNRRVKSKLKTLRKSVSSASASGNAEAASAAVSAYVSALDKAAKRGIVHPNKAKRHKSACAKLLKTS